MKVSADTYRASAQENILGADALWTARFYAPAQYHAGLAVECMLMAYSLQGGAEFDARHDLISWYDKSRLERFLQPDEIDLVAASMNTLSLSWRNEQRYYSEALLRAYFKRAALDRGMRGNIAKELTRQTVDAALVVVSVGEKRWKRLLKK